MAYEHISRSLSDLPETERTLLRAAVRDGYFKTLRETTLVELADQHGVSDRDASERLRSALDVVASAAVKTTPLDADDD